MKAGPEGVEGAEGARVSPSFPLGTALMCLMSFCSSVS